MKILKAIIKWIKGDAFGLKPLDFEVRKSVTESSYSVEFHNDDITSMEFVMAILITYFGFTIKEAKEKALEIHTKGVSVITGLEKESAEKLVKHIVMEATNRDLPFKCNVSKA